MRTQARTRMLSCVATLVLVLAAAVPARAVPLIVNGGFESGFNGWILADAVGSDGTNFAETDDLFIFQLGVDNVSLETLAVVPEPASWLLFATGLGALIIFVGLASRIHRGP